MRDLAGAGRFRLRFTIPGRLPGLNKYTRACRSGHQAGNAMKQAADGRVLAALPGTRTGCPRAEAPVFMRDDL